MKIALDPYMHRHLSLEAIAKKTAELGYDYIELSPRADFFDWWVMPRAYPERVRQFKRAMKEYNVQLATLQPMYRWSSPFEDERQSAINYWKKAIEIAVDLGCDTMISEFGRGASPERCKGADAALNNPEACEAAFWRSMAQLLPLFEREGITLSIEPHPEDWVETFHPAIDIVRMIGSPQVTLSYIAPHTFYYGEDMAAMLREAGPLLKHVRVADTFNPRASSGMRYTVNPPGSEVRVHQHLDIGKGEIDWPLFFRTLAETGFDGVLSACVFGWDDRADESSSFMRAEIQRYVDLYWPAANR